MNVTQNAPNRNDFNADFRPSSPRFGDYNATKWVGCSSPTDYCYVAQGAMPLSTRLLGDLDGWANSPNLVNEKLALILPVDEGFYVTTRQRYYDEVAHGGSLVFRYFIPFTPSNYTNLMSA